MGSDNGSRMLGMIAAAIIFVFGITYMLFTFNYFNKTNDYESAASRNSQNVAVQSQLVESQPPLTKTADSVIFEIIHLPDNCSVTIGHYTLSADDLAAIKDYYSGYLDTVQGYHNANFEIEAGKEYTFTYNTDNDGNVTGITYTLAS